MPEPLPARVAAALRALAARPDPAATLIELFPPPRGPFEPLDAPRGVTDEMIGAWLRRLVPDLAPWPERPCALPTEVDVLVIESGGVRARVPVPRELLPLFHRPAPGGRRVRPGANAHVPAGSEPKSGTMGARAIAWLRTRTDPAGYTVGQIIAGMGPPTVHRASLTPTLCALVTAGLIARVRKGRYAALKGAP